MKELKYNIKLMLSRNEFYFAVIGIFGIQLVQILLYVNIYRSNGLTLNMVYPSLYETSLLGNTFSFGIIHNTILPVLCALIFSDILFYEKESNVYLSLNLRLRKNVDLAMKVVVCFLFPFLICFLSLLFNYFLCQAIYFNGSYSDIFGSTVYHQVSYPFLLLENLRLSHLFAYFTSLAAILSLCMGMIAVLCLLLSPFLKSKSHVYFCGPILLAIIDMILSSIHLESFSLLNYTQFPAQTTISLLSFTLMVYFLIILALFVYQLKYAKR